MKIGPIQSIDDIIDELRLHFGDICMTELIDDGMSIARSFEIRGLSKNWVLSNSAQSIHWTQISGDPQDYHGNFDLSMIRIENDIRLMHNV